MANYRNDFADVNLETGTICRNFMNHSIGSGDALGDRFGVRVFRNGEPVSLGGTCAGYFVRNTTGETVVISSGVVSGNEAYVTLPAACYAVEGSFTLAIKVTSGSETVTMRIIDGVVSRTNTAVTVDPGTLVPSIETLISAINSAVGQIPVNYNASFAPAYSESSTYAVGDYVVYDGYLWRCTTAITETETWTAAHWKKVALASDVSDLKSAINLIEVTKNSSGLTIEKNKYVHSGTGEITSNTSHSPYAVSNIPVEGNGVIVKISECEVAGVRGFAFYDANGTFVPNSGIGYVVGQTIYFVDVPATAKKMAITIFGSDNIFSVQFVYYQKTDKTLTKENVPADGKITGEAVGSVKAIAEKNYSLIQSALDITETTYTDTPDRGVSAANAGFILSDASDKCSIKFTPLFSSTTNPYTNVASGSFTVRMYNITRAADDTVTLGDQIGSDVSYSIGDEIDIPYFDGTMLFDIRDAKDSSNNAINVAYLRSGKSWGNSLVSFANNTTSVTNWGVYGIGGQSIVTHAVAYGAQQLKSILNGKKLTVIGDSITHHNYRAKTNWAMWIADWTGATIQNLGVSGSGFTRGDPTIYAERISSIDNDVDVIGIAISWNDLGSNHPPIGDVTDTGTSSICGYINDFFDDLMEDFPTTPVIAYCQCPWVNRHPGIEDSDTYLAKVIELLKLRGIPFYYDLYNGGTLKPWISANSEYYFKMDDESSSHYPQPADGVHPNSEGHKVIARYLYPKFAENVVDVGMNYHLE